MNRSKRYVFIAFCVTAQGVRAQGIVRHFPAVIERAERKFWPALIERLQDEDWHVRGHAIIALKLLDSNYQLVPEIATFLEKETHPFVRYCAGIM